GGALHAAIPKGHYEVCKLLLEHGANPNADVESSGNCVSIARHYDVGQKMIDLLASYGGALTPELAVYDDDVETLAAMLRYNPSLHFDEAAVDTAFGDESKRVTEMIYRVQPDVVKRVHLKAKTPEFAHWLIERGAD